MVDIKSVLLDIVKHTSGLGIIENIKITGGPDGTELAAIDAKKSVIMNAKLHDHVTEFDGEFGMGSLGMLSSLTRLSNYQGDDADIEIVRAERNGEEIPTTLIFKDGEGNKDTYRFMSKEIVDQAMKVPSFRGAQWAVQVTPALKRISQLSEVAGIYSGVEPAFSVKTEGGDLVFEVGSAEGGIVGRRVFAENIDGEMGQVWSWPLAEFLAIIKLGGTIVVRFSDAGAAQIDVDSGIGIYTYTMPAMSR